MKVWFDSSVGTTIRANDCTAPLYRTTVPFPHTTEDFHSIRNHTLKHTSSLYIQPCYDEKWLVCSPTGSGRLAVLDAHSFLVLEQFRAGRTPLEVANATSEESLSTIEQFSTLLCNLGFLQDTHETSSLSYQDQADTLTAWLHITNACNLRCQYCYIQKTNEAIADGTAKKAIDAIVRSALKHHFQHVMLKYAGGEPSLRANSIFAIHDYAFEQAQSHNLELHAHVLSNGVLVPQQTIDNLKKRRIALSISLDGIGALHDNQRPFINGTGSFKYIDRTITRLLTNDLAPHILITVSKNTIPGLPDLMNYILERDLSFSISYYRDTQCSTVGNNLQFSDTQMIEAMRNVFTLIEQRLPRHSLLNALIDKADLSHSHKYTCGAGRNYLVIDQLGKVAKCQADIKRTITTVDTDDPLKALVNDKTGIQNIPAEEKQGCKQCTWRHWCSGGCPLLTYKITGRYDVKSPNCNIYQALIPEALKLEALRLLTYEEPHFITNKKSGTYSLAR